MRIRFRTFIVLQLIAFFGGMVTTVYLSCEPTSKIVPADFEKKFQICCNTIIEKSTELIHYAKSRWLE